MALYAYICRKHDRPLIFEIERSVHDEIEEKIPCPAVSCGKDDLAERHYPGQKFYGRVKGGYGGGPITK